MGCGLITYAAHLNTVLNAFDSGDKQLAQKVIEYNQAEIDSLCRRLSWSPPSLHTAINDLIVGSDEKQLRGAIYGYAYKMIIAYFGEALDNSHFYPCGSDFMMNFIDTEMESLDLGIEVSGLCFEKALVRFPSPDDLPGFGYWEAEECENAAKKLKAFAKKKSEPTRDLSLEGGVELVEGCDASINYQEPGELVLSEHLEQVMEWLETVGQKEGWAIFGFYY